MSLYDSNGMLLCFRMGWVELIQRLTYLNRRTAYMKDVIHMTFDLTFEVQNASAVLGWLLSEPCSCGGVG